MSFGAIGFANIELKHTHQKSMTLDRHSEFQLDTQYLNDLLIRLIELICSPFL